MGLTNVTHVRNSDNKNTLTWSANEPLYNYDAICIERSVNGGSWSWTGTHLRGRTTSWVDTSTQPNSSYTYRVRIHYYYYNDYDWYHYGSDSSWAYSNTTTYNTPNTPGKPAVSRVDANTVRLDFTNTGITQTATEGQRSSDGTTWTNIATITGSQVTTMTDVPGGGTWYYRVRNTRGSLVSDWSPVSDAVVTIQAPAAPTLLSPTGVVKKTDSNIVFSWKHNPLDGSVQTGAEVRWSTNGGSSWTTAELTGSNQFYTIANDFAVNANVVWQVRTKGAHANFGPWSASYNFSVYQVPQANLRTPASPVRDLPLVVTWQYSDQSGTQTNAVAIILNDMGKEVYRKALSGSGTTLTITSAEFLPENIKRYTLRLEVRSSSSLTAMTEIAFETDYTPPQPPIGQVDIDEEAGAATALVFAATGGTPATVAVGIFRRHADERLVPLVDYADSGIGYYDAYPPLDQGFEYVFVSYSESGVTAQISVPANISSKGYAYFNYGSGFRDLSKIALEMDYDYSLTHESQTYQTAAKGNPYPLIFYGSSSAFEGSVTGTAIRRRLNVGPETARVEDLSALSEWRGYVVMRLPHEPAIPVNIRLGQGFSEAGHISKVSVKWERVRADELAL